MVRLRSDGLRFTTPTNISKTLGNLDINRMIHRSVTSCELTILCLKNEMNRYGREAIGYLSANFQSES